jgi:hypothetical protein
VLLQQQKNYLIVFFPIFEIAVLLITVRFSTYFTFLLSKVAVLLIVAIPFTDETITFTHTRTIILSMTYSIAFETFEGILPLVLFTVLKATLSSSLVIVLAFVSSNVNLAHRLSRVLSMVAVESQALLKSLYSSGNIVVIFVMIHKILTRDSWK